MNEIEVFIENSPRVAQEKLKALRAFILKQTQCAEKISYGTLTFTKDNKNFVHIAGYAKHIGFYPSPSVIEAFESQLKAYKHAKGSVQFKLNEELPYDLIERMLNQRMKDYTDANLRTIG